MYPPPKKFFGLYCVGTLHSIPLNLGAEWSCVTMVHHHWLATTDITQDPCECSKIKLPRASKNPFSCGFCTYDPSLASRFRLVLIYENTTGSRWNASLYKDILLSIMHSTVCHNRFRFIVYTLSPSHHPPEIRTHKDHYEANQ